MFWVILTCTLAFGCTVAALYYWTDWKDALAKLDALKREADDPVKGLTRQYEDQVKEIGDVLPYTGFTKSGEDGMPPTPKAKDELRKRQEELLNDPYRKKDVDRQLSLDTLEDCVVVAVKDLDAALKKRDSADVEKRRTEGSAEKVKVREPEAQQTGEKTVAEIQVEIQAKASELQKLNAEFTATQQQEEEETKKNTAEFEAAEKKHKDEVIRMGNVIQELIRQLEEVKHREVIRYDVDEVHGKIYQVDTEGRRAFIDIGSAQRVVKNLRFRVAVPGDFGRLRYKGEVEVKRVWPTRAETAITAVDDREHPLVAGDLLVNPLFDAHRATGKVVAFAGEPASHLFRYNVNEATRRIIEIGSTVRDQATIDLDFLIVTEGYEGHRDYLKAVELQIPVAFAADILRFLGN